jgi:hypothetical protein
VPDFKGTLFRGTGKLPGEYRQAGIEILKGRDPGKKRPGRLSVCSCEMFNYISFYLNNN